MAVIAIMRVAVTVVVLRVQSIAISLDQTDIDHGDVCGTADAAAAAAAGAMAMTIARLATVAVAVGVAALAHLRNRDAIKPGKMRGGGDQRYIHNE